MVVNLWASLVYGLVLILAPDVFCELLQADPVNTAWLRTIGAALLGTNVLGSWLWLRNPNLDMGRVQTVTAGLEAVAMGASLLLGEIHSGQYLDGPGIRFPCTNCDDRAYPRR